MNRSMSIETIENAMKVTEEEFGVQWLSRQVERGKVNHPIPKQWNTTKNEFASFSSTGTFNINEDTVWLNRFTEDLRIARTLGGYQTAIAPRLKGDDFLKVQYEIYVAAYSVRRGFETHFVPASQYDKTADLHLKFGEHELHAECTQRDPYVPLQNLEGRGTKLLEAIRGQDYAGLELIIVALSAFEKELVPEILKKLGERDPSRIEQFMHGSGYGIYVHPLPPPEGDGYWQVIGGPQPPFTLQNGNFIPAGQNPAWSECRIAQEPNGQKYCTGHWRGYLHTISSHNLDALIRSFNQKRRQIPSGESGVIFVDLDVRHVHMRDISLYLDILAQGLIRCFSPTANTRVWAVILTTTPIPVHTGEGPTKFINLHRQLRVVTNPYAHIHPDLQSRL